MLFVLLGILIIASPQEDRCFSGAITECVSIAKEGEKKKDYQKAIQFYDSACILGDWLSCLKLSVVYGRGMWGVKRNMKISLSYSKAAYDIVKDSQAIYSALCDMKISSGCLNLGLFYMNSGDEKNGKEFIAKAFSLAKKGCEKEKFGPDCSTLSFMYREGIGVEKNIKKAQELYERACALEDGSSCYFLAHMYLDGTLGNDRKKYSEYLKKACEFDRLDACYELWKETGNIDYLEKACWGGFGYEEACSELYKKQNSKGNTQG